MKVFVAALDLIVVLSLSACAAIVPASSLPNRLEVGKASVARPSDETWFLDRREQTPSKLLLRRVGTAPPQTFFFSLEHARLSRAIESNATFRRLLREYQTAISDPNRHEVLSYNSKGVDSPSTDCVGYQMLVVDKLPFGGSQGPLFMRFEGLACRDPSSSYLFFDASYSERGSNREFDLKLKAEGDALLSSLRVEAVP